MLLVSKSASTGKTKRDSSLSISCELKPEKSGLLVPSGNSHSRAPATLEWERRAHDHFHTASSCYSGHMGRWPAGIAGRVILSCIIFHQVVYTLLSPYPSPTPWVWRYSRLSYRAQSDQHDQPSVYTDCEWWTDVQHTVTAILPWQYYTANITIIPLVVTYLLAGRLTPAASVEVHVMRKMVPAR